MLCKTMKINNFRGDLSDVSAKKEALDRTIENHSILRQEELEVWKRLQELTKLKQDERS